MIEDSSNLTFVKQGYPIDDVNGSFYNRFPYPQTPYSFSYLTDPDFELIMLNQDIGEYHHYRIPRIPDIWVAGCGTNQAVMTALRFRNATITGSDLAIQSLSIARQHADTFGLTSLTLRVESLNDTNYQEDFDYIICTGVIHHNANPALTLAHLAQALRPSGVLELMVYNSYYWGPAACFQRTLQLITRSEGVLEFDSTLRLARQLVSAIPMNTPLGTYVERFKQASDAVFADALIQPVLHGYTVDSLSEMASACGLSMLGQCVNIHDRAHDTLSWEMQFSDNEVQERYDALPDRDRWQITNLVYRDRAPYLWFYFGTANETASEAFAKTICDRFMNSVFQRASTTLRTYCRQPDGAFVLTPGVLPYPSKLSNSRLERIVEAVDGRTPMRTIFARLGIPDTFQSVNSIRIRLATSAFPYLRSVRGPAISEHS